MNGTKSIFDILKTSSGILIALFAIVGGVLVIGGIIDHKIETHLMNPEVLQKIEEQIHPSLMFNEKGILADNGGLRYIDENIDVTLAKDGFYPSKIVITPKVFLSTPPIINALDGYGIQFTPVQGKGISWEYIAEDNGVLLSRIETERHPIRFKLEVIK